MAYFRCFGCNKIWTKLVDDGCVNCGKPCEVLQWNLEPRRLPDYLTNFATNSERATETREKSELEPHAAPKANEHDRSRRLFDVDLSGTLAIPQEDDQTEYSASLGSPDSLVTSPSREVPIGSDLDFMTHTASPDFSDDGTEFCARLEKTLRVGQEENKSNEHSSKQETHQPARLASSTNEQQAGPAIQPSKPALGGKKAQKKVSKKALKKASRRTRIASTQEKPKAQLERPDPIPPPKALNSEQTWKQVLSRQAAKRNVKLEVAAHKGQEVNESPSLMRRLCGNEDECPSAQTARFGFRGAKHDVTSIVPREFFEFEAFD